MRVEIPALRRCCCCLPLRHGLLSWGYLKLILSTAALGLVITIAWKTQDPYRSDKVSFALWGTVAATSLIFQLILVIGAHKKNYNLLRVYYRASVIGAVTTIILLGLWVGLYSYRFLLLGFKYPQIFIIMFGETFIFVVDILLQVYLILLLRSEILKLQGLHEFSFVNVAAEAEAGADAETGSETGTETRTIARALCRMVDRGDGRHC